MKERVYVLLDVPAKKGKEVSRTLGKRSGVISADILEDQSGVMVLIEAGDRKQLAARAVQAITSVELLTTGLRLLPVQNRTKPLTISVTS